MEDWSRQTIWFKDSWFYHREIKTLRGVADQRVKEVPCSEENRDPYGQIINISEYRETLPIETMEDWSRQQGSLSKSWKGAMSEKWLLNISKGNLCQFNFNSGQFGRSCVGSGPDSTNIIESTLVRSATKYAIPWLQFQNNTSTLSYYVWNKIVWLLEKVLNNRLFIHRKNCCIYTFVSEK